MSATETPTLESAIAAVTTALPGYDWLVRSNGGIGHFANVTSPAGELAPAYARSAVGALRQALAVAQQGRRHDGSLSAPSDADRLLRLPFTASLDPDELGVIRDVEGRAVCVVDAERDLADVDVARLVWLLCASVNRFRPRTPADLAESAWSALETIRAVLAPAGETNEAAMAALQVAEDALAELHGAGPNPREGKNG
ncbi:hypothetical protein [Methylobacterium oryzihabitans]|uniref:Uncharacterized protein n=1 Tax=Methylobacterium oryzihabitans TaxID=2499852 RepID=A0A437NYU3_9HYPH|nr:hypothetical protein [Methylobacterium oryzihabitans]RVU15199.1 hypothetical protein EOE48_20535 [Methylobacterium oryzihabitans]